MFNQDWGMEQLRQNMKRRTYTQFHETFIEGFLCYRGGNWLKAVEKFN